MPRSRRIVARTEYWPSFVDVLTNLLLVFIFLHEGFGILGNYAAAATYMQKSGVPSLMLPAVIALQLGCGLLIAAGC